MNNQKHQTVILITGQKRSGKDTVAKMLQEYLPKSTISSFAGPMKDITANTFNITLEELDYAKNEGRLKALLKFKRLVFFTDFRKFLQRFGTEGMRPVFGDKVWVEQLVTTLPLENTVIASDWRFPLEKNYLEYLGYDVKTVKVLRENKREKKRDMHSSEQTDRLIADAVLVNDGTLDELHAQVARLAADILKAEVYKRKYKE